MYAKLLYFHLSFSYICCIINRHEKQANASVFFPNWCCTFFLSLFTLQPMFHRIYNRKLKNTNKNKAWHKLNFLLPAHRSSQNVHISELWSRSKSQGAKNIYIYIIIHSYTIYIIWDYKAKWAENEDVSTRNNLSERGGGDFPCTQWTFVFK